MMALKLHDAVVHLEGEQWQIRPRLLVHARRDRDPDGVIGRHDNRSLCG
jgi:hypothetical protein